MISGGNRQPRKGETGAALTNTTPILLRLQPQLVNALVGAGGIGKTRLALEVAAGIRDASAGAVALVELAALANPELVAQVVVAGLGIAEQPHRTPEDVLINAVRSRRLLLVLDNCEHLIAACARLTDRLLVSCSGVTVLATSREPLGIAGETVWRVPSTVGAREPVEPDRGACGGERSRAAVRPAGCIGPTISQIAGRVDLQLVQKVVHHLLQIITRLPAPLLPRQTIVERQ
jgi:hypothetical protein